MENTGRHHQFYEKFNTRHHIAVILRELWSVPDHRQRMLEQSRYGNGRICAIVYFPSASEYTRYSIFDVSTHSSGEPFVRFVNYLIVDMTYLMDEILRLLALIRDFELLKRNTQQWESMPQVWGSGASDVLAVSKRPSNTQCDVHPLRDIIMGHWSIDVEKE